MNPSSQVIAAEGWTTFEQASVWGAWITALGTVVLAIAAIGALLVARRQLKKVVDQAEQVKAASLADHDRRKKQATLEAWSAMRESRGADLQNLFTAFRDSPTLDEATARAINTDPEKAAIRSCLSRYLAALERMAVGVDLDIYDCGVLMEIAYTAVTGAHDQYRHFIADVRQAQRQPTAFSALEKLAARMRRESEAPPQPSNSRVIPPVTV